jgi:hypothetical protein
MSKRKSQKEEVLASLDLPIDAGDPKVCVKALVKITEAMCDTLGKDRMQGALSLAAAAAFLVDSECGKWATEKGEQQDGARTMNAYVHNTMAAWNGFLVMFKDVDPKIAGMSVVGFDDEDEDVRPEGETLQ